MKFGAVSLPEALGATLAHSIRADAVSLTKGEVVSAVHIEALAAAGVREVVVARLDHEDVGENAAAQMISEALATEHLVAERAFTGRSNLTAATNGVFCVDQDVVDRLNAIDEALTLATLPSFRAVSAGEMAATIKIIPFAVPRSVVDRAVDLLRHPAIYVRPFRPLRVAALSTILSGLKPSVVRKAVRHLSDRLLPALAPIVIDETLPHEVSALAERLKSAASQCDIIVVFGATAIADRRDVVPSALLQAGGTIEQFGMPVDPGNLLLLGQLGAAIVIGAPGCARSPRENGFDWVLQRLLACIPVTHDDIRVLGVGGLLMEIITRPQPREKV